MKNKGIELIFILGGGGSVVGDEVDAIGVFDIILKKRKEVNEKSFDNNYDGVFIFRDADLVSGYFKLVEAFESFKKAFAEKKIEPYKELFKNKPSIEFIKKLNPSAYEVLKSSKHFGIKKEKHRLAQEYVKQAKKRVINYLNAELYNDDFIGVLRKEVLEKQIDIICLKRKLKTPVKVYVQNKENSELYEYSKKYTDYLEMACADGSNVGFSSDEYIIHNLFDKMAEKMLKLDIWKEED